MSENYHDFDGNPVSLERLCRIEPAWATSRIRHLRAENERMRAALEEIEEESYEVTTVMRAGEGLRGKV